MPASHRELTVWHKAMDVAVQVYRLTERFPRSEMYRLTSQLTRAAASVPANIAEGTAGERGGTTPTSSRSQKDRRTRRKPFCSWRCA